MTPLAALIAACATLIVAAITFAGFVITKDQKTTDFRQAWIDAQRADLATVISVARRAASLPPARQRALDLTDFNAAAARISLREKPSKPEWTGSLVVIDSLRRRIGIGKLTRCRAYCYIRKIECEARQNLKTEWERVKNGEPTYQRWKVWIPRALIILALLIAAAAWCLWMTAPSAPPSLEKLQ